MVCLPCSADEDCALAGVSSEVEVEATAIVGGRWQVAPPGRPVHAPVVTVAARPAPAPAAET
eukprot:5067986-Alexandrium_andersonii.AAC.1